MSDRQTDEWLKMRRDLHYAQKEIQNLRKRLKAVQNLFCTSRMVKMNRNGKAAYVRKVEFLADELDAALKGEQ